MSQLFEARTLFQNGQNQKTKSFANWGKTYRISNASVYLTCEEQEFEDASSSKETIYYAEQKNATVEKVHHTGSKAEFHSI